jgi:small subunit ribosomal protein S6
LNKKGLEIHKEVSMRAYETAFLIAPTLPEEDNEKLIEQMAEIVSKKKGKMVNIDKWGKRRLAYPIKKYEEAFYVFFLYEGDPAVLAELERRFKQTEAILRYLTVKTEVKEPIKKKGRAAPRRKKREAPAKKEPLVESAPEEATTEDRPSKEADTDALTREAAAPDEAAPDKTTSEATDRPGEKPEAKHEAEEKSKEEA